MTTIGISEKAQGSHPTLVAWLAGAGIETARLDPAAAPARDAQRILHVTEFGVARQHDILIDFADGLPVLRRAKVGRPATVVFGFEDMAFGHALIAELIRPRIMPACGEPDSARFLSLAARVARSDATVLLLGETGTGKEGVARFVHAVSARHDKPFVAVNCAALPETMLEAILFGHQKGAFTGASAAGEGFFRAAEGGTLLLDEIAEMPLQLQSKLLRVLQEREVIPIGASTPIPIDVRIIACANRDLQNEVAAGRFRSDLYYRLSVFPLTTRSLADRPQDIPALAAAMILRHSGTRQSIPWPDQGAIDTLMAHDWPGNVRELENVIQRALLFAAGDTIGANHIVFDRRPEPKADPVPGRSADTLANVVQFSEFQAIRETLAACGGSRIETARRLGISERTLRYRLARAREQGEDITRMWA